MSYAYRVGVGRTEEEFEIQQKTTSTDELYTMRLWQKADSKLKRELPHIVDFQEVTDIVKSGEVDKSDFYRDKGDFYVDFVRGEAKKKKKFEIKCKATGRDDGTLRLKEDCFDRYLRTSIPLFCGYLIYGENPMGFFLRPDDLREIQEWIKPRSNAMFGGKKVYIIDRGDYKCFSLLDLEPSDNYRDGLQEALKGIK